MPIEGVETNTWTAVGTGVDAVFRVSPDAPVAAEVVGRGWDLEVVAVGPLSAELRWPDILVPPYRGSQLKLRLRLGEAEGIAAARVVGLADDGLPGMRVTVVWEDVPTQATHERRVRPRWDAPVGGPRVEIQDPVTGTWGPALTVVDASVEGLGLEVGEPLAGIAPGLGLRARLLLGDGSALPFGLRLTRARLRVGPTGEVLRLGVALTERNPAFTAALADWLFQGLPGCTPQALTRAGFPVEGLATGVTWVLLPGPAGLELGMRHQGVAVAGATVSLGDPPGEGHLDDVWMDDAYRCPALVIAFWQALALAAVARGCEVITGEDVAGLFRFLPSGGMTLRVNLGDVLTGAGQSPREWRRWHAPAYEVAVARGQLRPGVLRGARAALYGAVAR